MRGSHIIEREVGGVYKWGTGVHPAPQRRDLLGLLLRRVVSGEHVFQRGLGDASSAGNEPRQPPVPGQECGGGRSFNFVEQSALVVGVIRVTIDSGAPVMITAGVQAVVC